MEYKNTKIAIKSLGDVELKYISGGDINDFLGYLDLKGLSDRQFVIKVLHHQLVTPKLELDELEKVSDQELGTMAKAFVATEDHAFESYKEAENTFTDFRTALEDNLADRLRQIEKSVEPFQKSAEEAHQRVRETVRGLEKAFPKVSLPRVLTGEQEVLVPGSSDITREQNNWRRHTELLDSVNASLAIQEEILGEQRGNTTLTKWVIAIAIATLIAAIVPLLQ